MQRVWNLRLDMACLKGWLGFFRSNICPRQMVSESHFGHHDDSFHL